MYQLKLVSLLVIALIINGTAYTPAETIEVEAINKTEVIAQPVKEESIEEESTYPDSYIQEGLEDVKFLFDMMIKSYETENLDGVINVISNNDNVVFISSGSDILIGKDEIITAFKKDFETTKNVKIRVPWVYVTGKGNFAVVTAIINADIKLEEGSTSISARQTMTFEKEEDGWKIINSHLSYPAERAVDKDEVDVEVEVNDDDTGEVEAEE